MEPTDFEKWCAGEMGCTPEYIMKWRVINMIGGTYYTRGYIHIIYRAYMAGVRSILPYQTPPQPPEE
ncbi:hypothetical protein ISO55_05700 [Morganella morganii subsp. morganii]|uniref:hypothetical protein n=1 Tax=Morganella morganii TaxID=582 RepID=UPI001BDB4482|nr:hypothetical protein [Morganella morganii]MBT0366461.1 hypothetical protein [Morganella morganii subsp. morganii]